jgi:hypothetical protein
MDVQRVVGRVASQNDGLVEWSLLRSAGLSADQAFGATRPLRRLHDGVFLTGYGRVTREQRWRAATLTAPGTVLSHASAADCWGIRPWRGSYDIVTRPGSGGPRRIGALLACRSTRLAGDVTARAGIPITTPARTILDLAPRLTKRQTTKAVREAIRLKVVTPLELRLAAAAHRGRRGAPLVAALGARFETLPIARARSDAEARALEVLDAAGVEPPEVNVLRAGLEADLSWPATRRIIEIDGAGFHLDADEDARRDERWRSAGWSVERISSDIVFDAPFELVALARTERPGTWR